MSRVRMSWDWVGDYPIFVYTTYIDRKKFHVKVVKGTKGEQNAGNTGPNSEAWFEYVSEGLASKNAVDKEAFQKAAEKLNTVYECCY